MLCGLWPVNMGNSFLQLGAKTLVQAAFPSAEVFLTSALPRWLMMYGYQVPDPFGVRQRTEDPGWKRWSRQILGLVARRYDDSALRTFTPPDPEQALDLASVGAYDLIVMPGMLLCEFIIQTIGSSLRAARRAGTQLLFLGAGLEKYSPEEAAIVRRFLREIEPIGLASRDQHTFDLMAESVPHSYQGMDCGFFVADAFRPPPVRLREYVVATFDKYPPPPLATSGRLLVHAHHRCFGPIPREYWGATLTLISDLPEDYLTLYANAQEVHSSRVHACVAALAYDVPARLYSDTPRARLFDAVGMGEVRTQLVTVDRARMELQKASQLSWLRSTVASAFPAATTDGRLPEVG